MADFEYTNNVIARNLVFNSIDLTNKVSGYTTPAQWDLIVGRYGFNDNGGDHTTDRSSWSLTGYDKDNTTAVAGTDGSITMRIYFKATGTTDYVIGGYLDEAMTASLVISGTESTRTTGSTVTLSEENSSGLSGTVVIGDAATNDTWYVDIETHYAIYDSDVDGGKENIRGFLSVEDDSDAADSVWKIAVQGEIVSINNLIDTAGIDNCVGTFNIETLRKDLLAVGWSV